MRGFFSKPVDNLLGEPCITRYLAQRNVFYRVAWLMKGFVGYKDAVVVCKNAGMR
jgi:phosphoribosylpyrophosphate synthetase